MLTKHAHLARTDMLVLPQRWMSLLCLACRTGVAGASLTDHIIHIACHAELSRLAELVHPSPHRDEDSTLQDSV